MPVYNYTALNNAGKWVRKRVEASSVETAKASLRSTGYMVLEIKAQSDRNPDINLPFLGTPKPKEMAVFCRQFASILRAGVPIAGALGILGQQTPNKLLRDAIRSMQSDLEKGTTLADAMRRHPRVFSPMLLSMVSAGEESGNLEAVFTQMEVYFDKSNKTRNAVRGAMMYPAILAVVMVVAVVVMMTKIIPMFMEVFEGLDMELPMLTQIVIAATHWFGRWWWALFLGLAAAVVGVALFRRTSRGKHLFGLLARKLPVIRDLTVQSASSAFCRTQALLMASGLNLTDSLALTAQNMTNIWYREAVEQVRTLVMRGVTLTTALRDTELFPPMVLNMVGIGEESGDLTEMLAKTANYFDEETDLAIARVLALLQPALILFMTGFVVIIVLSIFLPMLNMTQAYDQYL